LGHGLRAQEFDQDPPREPHQGQQSRMMAASTGQTHDCTRPHSQQSQLALDARAPSTHDPLPTPCTFATLMWQMDLNRISRHCSAQSTNCTTSQGTVPASPPRPVPLASVKRARSSGRRLEPTQASQSSRYRFFGHVCSALPWLCHVCFTSSGQTHQRAWPTARDQRTAKTRTGAIKWF
jgi:hypothetical protein